MNFRQIALILWTLYPALTPDPASRNHRKRIIIDTDLFSDVDDVGSLAIANVLHNCRVADLAGVVINTPPKYGALAASVVNTYFGNPDIPIAAMRPLTEETFVDTWDFVRGEYASRLANNWPRSLSDSSTTPTPASLYRSILSSSKDHSVTLISLGILTNLAELLRTPSDTISPLPGPALISKKVRELVVMGGQYPSGREFNFAGVDPESARHVVNSWPRDVPITYVGFELGRDIFSGAALATDAPPDSPVRAAYEWYVGRGSTVRESWDPLATLYGIMGLDASASAGLGVGRVFEYVNEIGYNEVVLDGSNTWVNDSTVSNQRWLKLADGVTNVSVARLLDQFYVYDPLDRSCTFTS